MLKLLEIPAQVTCTLLINALEAFTLVSICDQTEYEQQREWARSVCHERRRTQSLFQTKANVAGFSDSLKSSDVLLKSAPKQHAPLCFDIPFSYSGPARRRTKKCPAGRCDRVQLEKSGFRALRIASFWS